MAHPDNPPQNRAVSAAVPRARVVVTRPLEDARPFAAHLEAAGFRAIIAPLMTIEAIPGPPPDLAGIQALAFTSANGVRAYAARGGRTGLPVFAVGAASADLCRQSGFGPVIEAGGDVDSLARTILDRCAPAAGGIYHGAGATLAGDLVALLERGGLAARRETLYAAEAVHRLPKAFADVLNSPDAPPAVITFLSPRTARLASRLIAEAELTPATAHATALCLSPAVAKAARNEPWHAVLVASEPKTASILACLESWIGRT